MRVHEVEPERTLRAVDFDPQLVLRTEGDLSCLNRARRSRLQPRQHEHAVLRIDRHFVRRILGRRPLGECRRRICHHGVDRSGQVLDQIKDVRRQIGDHAAAGRRGELP